jgi:hypothetical protein
VGFPEGADLMSHMNHVKNCLKGIAVLIVTFAVFLLLKKLIGNIGGMPRVFTEAYPPSIFVRMDIVPAAASVIMTIIMTHLLLNYMRVRRTIPVAPMFRGSMYGFMYGILWFFGFLEMVVVNNSDVFRHVSSGVRDCVSLGTFGTMAGILFYSRDKAPVADDISFVVIIPVSIFFALFHQAQFYFTFPEVNQHVYDVRGVVWLFAAGAWIGFMYYVFRLSGKSTLRRVVYFSVNLFGINWLLYNSFYRVFIDIPVSDIIIRCAFDVAGVIAGLCVYEFGRKMEKRMFSSVAGYL